MAATDRTATPGRVELAYYSVYCGACGEPLPAPYTLIGWQLWTPQEVRETRRAYCAACDSPVALGAPQEAEEAS